MNSIAGTASEGWRSVTACVACVFMFLGCATRSAPDLGAIYDLPAMNIGSERNPVIVIPGILGSRLESTRTQQVVWGAFVYGAADADRPEGARLIALPMEPGVPLGGLQDEVVATEVLDTLELDLGLLRGLKLDAYVDILMTLAVGEYRDASLGRSGAIDYGGQHYTCFQLPYDWRRDVSEQAVELHELILAAKAAQPSGSANRRVDVVAHSMGGLVLRYYLRYGPNPIGPDGVVPPLTWDGAEHVERAVIIGTPNAGSVQALERLVEGAKFAPFTPFYRPAVMGTMPAIYQLLPRPRHARVVDAETGEAIDLYDADEWERRGWGLTDPDQMRVLRWLLPDAADDAERRAIAREHLAEALARARALHEALDSPAPGRPEHLAMTLFASSSERTPDVLAADGRGRLRTIEHAAGDGTVTRASALGDERVGVGYQPRLRSAIDYDEVYFIHTDHLGLTRDAAFVDNLLWLLLEAPRAGTGDGARSRR